MADLYNQLEELQGMTYTLIGDMESLKNSLGSRNITNAISEQEDTNRRFYIRAIFAFIEAVVEQHKRLLLKLHERKYIKLKVGYYEVLSERIFTTSDRGNVTSKDQYLQLQRKIRTVYRAAGESFDEEMVLNFGDNGWQIFRDAIKIRNRITHPKTREDCEIETEDLETIELGEEWFRSLNNEFVRVARLHRIKHQW
jgi:hypothetical protein